MFDTKKAKTKIFVVYRNFQNCKSVKFNLLHTKIIILQIKIFEQYHLISTIIDTSITFLTEFIKEWCSLKKCEDIFHENKFVFFICIQS